MERIRLFSTYRASSAGRKEIMIQHSFSLPLFFSFLLLLVTVTLFSCSQASGKNEGTVITPVQTSQTTDLSLPSDTTEPSTDTTSESSVDNSSSNPVTEATEQPTPTETTETTETEEETGAALTEPVTEPTTTTTKKAEVTTTTAPVVQPTTTTTKKAEVTTTTAPATTTTTAPVTTTIGEMPSEGWGDLWALG
jgi:hypothetical protein